MSFTGDLEHLPIVDIMQLLHATRKSGTLGVRGRRGECELVFQGGYIVSANHSQNMVRIGQVLVDMGAISQEALNQALQVQTQAGANRRPLVATLIEEGQISRETAYKGLESLIELTIVDILTWTTGTFSLDVDKIVVSDEYRYFPEHLRQEISVNTQSVLMDALRIYDEKKRDGDLLEAEEDEEEDAGADSALPPLAAADRSVLSADDLGLDDLDRLEKKVPGIFTGLADPVGTESFPRQTGRLTAGLSAEEQKELNRFLREFSPDKSGSGPTVILFSPDKILRYALMSLGKHAGFLVFTTDDESDLGPIIDQSLGRLLSPVLIVDSPHPEAGGFVEERIADLHRQTRQGYPEVTVLQLVARDDESFALRSLVDGARSVFPRPLRSSGTSFLDDFKKFLQALRIHLSRPLPASDKKVDETPLGRVRDMLADLKKMRGAPQISFFLLQVIAGRFARALTLVVGSRELVAERGLGFRQEEKEGAVPFNFRIPLDRPSIFRQVVEEGRLFYGPSPDTVMQQHLFSAIDPPLRPLVLLLPLRSGGRTISLTYADFGPGEPSGAELDLLHILAAHAGLVLENVSLRKRLELSPR